MISMVVVLPAPLGPSSPKQHPFGHLEGDAVDRRDGGVLLDEIADLQNEFIHVSGTPDR